MTTFRRFLSLASASMLAASLAVASELTWDFTFAPSDVSLTPVGEYTVVSLSDGSNVRDALGAPAIPAKFANILLPDGATDVSIAATGDLVLLASDITPYPVQRVAPKSKPQPPFTAPNPAAYASSSPWPAAIATYEGLHEMQGSTFVSVRVNPLVYIASEKALYYRPTVAVTVTYTAPSTAPRSTRSVSQNALATEMVNALVVNPESADSPSAVRRRATARASTVDYLIITSSTLSNSFQNLANYRATVAGGSFKTLVVTTNTIASSYSGDDIQMKIRNCISNYVKTAGTTYVVLGGDDSVVPDRDCYAYIPDSTDPSYEYHMPTDLYYSDLTGTWKASGNTNFGVRAANVDMSPDVIVGRIPVRTAAQLNGYLAKVQAFEADTSHTRNSIIMGGPAAWCRYYGSKRPDDDVSVDGHAAFRASNRTYVSDSEMWLRRLYRDGIKPYWDNAESASTRTIKIATDSLTSWDSSTCGDKELNYSNLKNWFNNGYTHMMFSGHGFPQGWGMEGEYSYSVYQAEAQTGLVPFIYTDACLTGAFDCDGQGADGTITYDGEEDTSEPCLGEAFIRNSSGGSLVHMGCARYGWGTPDSGSNAADEDGYYTNRTASATGNGGPSTVYAYKFYNRLYESAAVSSNRTVGAAFAMSKADMISECSTDDCERWIQFGLNYLGDPAIALYPRAVENTAPEFSSTAASATGVAGETFTYDFASLLTAGYPVPTYRLHTSVSSYNFDTTTGVLTFTPSATGNYNFTCMATNTAGSATCALTVTVTPAPPETPSEVAVVSSDSFTATWSPVSGATAYELLVIEGATGGGSGATVTETFANASFSTTGSSYANQTISGCDLGTWTATQCRGDYETPVVKATGTLTSPAITGGVASVEFDYVWPFSSDSSGTCDIDLYVGGTYKDSATVTAGTSGTASYTSFDAVSGTPTIMFTNKAASNKRIRVTEVRIGTAGSRAKALPRAAGDVVYSNSVGNVTNFTVTGLQPETTYSYSVRAIVNGEPTGWSDSVTVTTAEGDSAPSISVEQTSYAVTVGDPDVDFMVTVTGSPAPTVTHSCTEGAYYVFEDGELRFTPNTVGTYHFVFTATNTEGSDTVTVTVEVSPAPVTVPTLTVSDVASTSATASWTACDNVSSYTLQLASDNQFTTGGSGGGESVELVKEGFDNGTTLPSGWTVESGSIGGTYESNSTGNYGVSAPSLKLSSTVTISTPTLSNPTNVSFWGKGLGSGFSSTLEIQQLLGGTWSEVDTLTITGTATTFSYSLNPSATQVRFIFTKASGNLAFDDVVITGTSGSSGSSSGSLISSETVAGLSHTFTGLSSETTYYARVKGTNDWSTPVGFTTDPAGDSAPVWTAFPAQTYRFGANNGVYVFNNVGSYASGSPAPVLALNDPSPLVAELEDGQFTFVPDDLGTFSFVITASNSLGVVSNTLTVTVDAIAPELAAIGDRSGTLESDVTFEVSATGDPAPVFDVTSSDADAVVVEQDGANYFLFTPSAIGTYHFTVTASNIAGSDSESFTVNVVRTVPVLTVTNVTDTTAFASWIPCDGVSAYTLQLSTNAFPAASSAARKLTTLLSETFADAKGMPTTAIANFDSIADNDGWEGSYVYAHNETVRISSGSNTGDIESPWLTNATAGATVTLAFDSLSWTNAYTTVNVTITEDGSTYSDPISFSLTESMATYTTNFTVSGTRFRVNWAPSAAKKRFFLDNVRITTPESSGGDDPGNDSIQEFTVAGTSHTFTNLTPETTYYSRVKGNAGWSETVSFQTLGTAATAPSIAAIADQTYTYGDNDGEFTLTVTASGTPSPTLSVTSDDAIGLFDIDAAGEFIFLPTAVGTFHFTVTATNGIPPDATASFAVTVTGTAPTLAAIADQTVAVEEGQLTVPLTVTGNPAPTVTVASADAPDDSFCIDSNGDFYFLFDDATGTFHFTITAANGVSPNATQSFTVTVTGGDTPVEPLEIVFDDFSATASSFTVQGATPGQSYDFLWTADLLVPGFTTNTVVAPNTTFTVDFPNAGTWFGYVRPTP